MYNFIFKFCQMLDFQIVHKVYYMSTTNGRKHFIYKISNIFVFYNLIRHSIWTRNEVKLKFKIKAGLKYPIIMMF